METSEASRFAYDEVYIHQFQPVTTHKISTSRSTEFKDILPWYISQNITKIIPINTRVVIRYAIRRSIPLWVLQKVNGNQDNILIRISKWRKGIVELILAPEEINKCKRAGHLRSKNYKKSLPALLVVSEQVIQSLWWTLKSPNILADGLIERALSILDEIALKTVQKDRKGKGDWWRKKRIHQLWDKNRR